MLIICHCFQQCITELLRSLSQIIDNLFLLPIFNQIICSLDFLTFSCTFFFLVNPCISWGIQVIIIPDCTYPQAVNQSKKKMLQGWQFFPVHKNQVLFLLLPYKLNDLTEQTEMQFMYLKIFICLYIAYLKRSLTQHQNGICKHILSQYTINHDFFQMHMRINGILR